MATSPFDSLPFATLEAMELTPLWRLRAAWPKEARERPSPAERASAAAPTAEQSPSRAPLVAQPLPVPQRTFAERRPPSSVTKGATAETVARSSNDPTRSARIATLDWDQLEAEIRACAACALSRERTQAVPGVGNRHAEWFFVGEGPGREEDRIGEPFVGPAGKLLDEMLFALGLDRSQVFIANAVKCRPPLNRTPHVDEIAACFPFLARQIALVAPRIIVALGKPAALALLNEEVKIAEARGKRFAYQGIPVVVTYHPAYLLRNPADKRKAWEDLLRARQIWAQRI